MEYSRVEPHAWIDEWLPSRRRTVGVVWNDDRPIGDRFPNTEVPVPAEPTICAEDPEAWFATSGPQRDIARTKNYCTFCWMMQECRDYGLKHPGLDGIWGGLSKAERQGKARHRTTH
jgi:hypothetical protein